MNNTTKKLVGAIAALVLLGLLVSGGGFGFALPSVGYNNGYQPEQPIPYDHSLHAGKYQIPCMYCHTNADKSKNASVPSGNICMNCHVGIGGDKPWIKAIQKAYNSGTSIQWVKVHMLPDFVQFNHKRHVAKGVACQTCHGPVQEMKEVYQFTDLSMGWCVNCHRKPEYNAPTQCTTCHY